MLVEEIMAGKTNILLDGVDARELRRLAELFGITIERGPGAGELGNLRELLHRMARAYERQPRYVEGLIKQVLAAGEDGQEQ